jgi:hypothetical protein
MTSIVRQVQGLLGAFEAATRDPDELRRLSDFYDRMKREGVATTRPYNLPQLDTIGRSSVPIKRVEE